MAVTKAVSPSVLTPGLYLKINLLAGAAGISNGALRTLIIAPKSSAGDLVVDSEIRVGGGEDSAGAAFGVGTFGHLAARQLYDRFPTAIVDFAAPTAGTGAATRSITISGSPTANIALGVRVAGREWEVGWNVGETADDVKTKVVNSVLQRTNDLPITASSGGVGIVAFNGKVTGRISNDVQVRLWLKNTVTGTEAISSQTLAGLTGGTTDPDITTLLALAAGKEYHFILLCLSNTDAELTSASSNVERALTHVQALNEGLDAKLQTVIYASTGTLANATAAAISRNLGYCEHVYCMNGQSLPCEWAAAAAGDTLAAISIDPAANRIGNRLGSTLYGPQDTTGDNPTLAEKETAIGNGVSIVALDTTGELYFVRPVTTYSQTSTGSPDRRLLDTQNVHATYIVARDVRTALPAEFPNAKIIKDQPPGQQEIPEGVTEERDIRSFVTARLRAWVRAGVIIGAKLEAAIDAGQLIVQVDDQDETQVNIVLPFSIIKPLAKTGVVVNRIP